MTANEILAACFAGSAVLTLTSLGVWWFVRRIDRDLAAFWDEHP